MQRSPILVPALLLAALALPGLLAAQSTALKTQPQAEKYLNDQAKGNLVKILGPKNDEGQTSPEVWQYVFFDPFASNKGRFVQIYQGQHLLELTDRFVETDRGRLLAYKEDEVIPPNSVKLDSDAALAAAVQAGNLGGYELSGAEYELLYDQKLKSPVWIINLFGPYQGKEVKAATARIDANSGQVHSFKLHEENLTPEKPSPSTKR
ncbi:MAG: hypothetical protein AAGK14_07665 [Verrucomicrobiota bacterium]